MPRQLLNEVVEEVIREQSTFRTAMGWEVNRMVLSLDEAQLEEITGLKNQPLEDLRDIATTTIAVAIRQANEN